MWEHQIGEYYDLESAQSTIRRLEKDGYELVSFSAVGYGKYGVKYVYAMKRMVLPTEADYTVE